MIDFVANMFREGTDVIWILFGVLLMVGSIRNWDWLCDPTGKPHAPLMTRGMLRFSFFCLGIVLCVCGIWTLMKRFG